MKTRDGGKFKQAFGKKESGGLQAIRDGVMRKKIVAGAELKKPAPPRWEGSDIDAESMTVQELVEHAARLTDRVYRVELFDEGRFIGNVFVVLDHKLTEKFRQAGGFGK